LNILWKNVVNKALTFSPSSMPMVLRFGLLMESVSSCMFLSKVFSCLTNSSSVFPLILIFIFFCVFSYSLFLVF
jgi:hypothetical protein